jgi:GNAT superfamily N-acetyltransferase
VRIEQFDPQADSQRLGQCYEIFASCLPHDDPRAAPMGPDAFQAWWATGFGVTPRQTWIATDDSGAVGCYLLELPDRENTWMSWCMPVVPLDARRHGIGTELLTHCAAQAREAGRTHLSGEIREGTAGYAFATAAGVSYGLTEIRRDLELDAELAARLPRLRAAAEPAAAGYELLRWIGATPEEHLDQVAQVNEAMADAPRDEGREAEHWDADRVREADQGKLSNRLEQFTIAARHAASGEMAALTQVIYDPETAGWGFQGLTAVTGPHRGHRLGMLLKVAMLEWLPELGRDIQRVQTWNSESNEHMVGINVQLGFQISARFRSWELPVADYLDRARSRPAAASKGR